ncbi:OB-fold nucleic acid binding domain-containing protein [Saxibacter everestensis]|uniref:OB-fold nucleic acid binding domain-containing protein n=1 Tax=Saxibacter everestensis TaxID=2909229 RepID=A0ABY8QY90_9MICO|nr:OB-fold nucleic acid binding domain-containing protein [Brevibacteriaceae bacterium ZFBP1038]
MKKRLLAFLNSRDEIEAHDDAALRRSSGSTSISELSGRGPVRLGGIVATVTESTPEESPSLWIELSDGSGVVRICWLGRRKIRGIHPGRQLEVEGMVSYKRGRPTLFNPTYTLIDSDRER